MYTPGARILQRLSGEQAPAECLRTRERHPEHVPCILEHGSVRTPKLDKEKFLVSEDFSVSQFLYVLRRRMEVKDATQPPTPSTCCATPCCSTAPRR